jgi:hypothetical protein
MWEVGVKLNELSGKVLEIRVPGLDSKVNEEKVVVNHCLE